jgi:ferredoxin/flavodoxin
MSVKIFYYSGTGNALWATRTIAKELDTTDICSIVSKQNPPDKIEADSVGFIFPVYIWGVPVPVIQFIESIISNLSSKYVFAVAVHGGQVASTLLQIEKILQKHGIVLSIGAEIRTPSNYIPWGGPEPEDKQKQFFEEGRKKLTRIATSVKAKKNLSVEKGVLWQRILFSGLFNPLSVSHIPTMDKPFWSDDKCNKCGICGKVCPAENVSFTAGKPQWNGKCHQCFACLQWCPQQAIQYGKKTSKYKRYHNPEVTVNDIIRSKS